MLLAGPALVAVSRRFPGARLTGVGDPERWGLLKGVLPLEAVWRGDEAAWAWLFSEEGPVPAPLKERLGSFRLSLVFTPRPYPTLLARLAQAGIGSVVWVPSFPETGTQPVAALQAARLAHLGIRNAPATFRLQLDGKEDWPEDLRRLAESGPYLALAPGSGHAAKNWPLPHYYEVARALSWEHKMQVVWLTGPAEAAWLPYLDPLARAQGQLTLAHRPLSQVAAVLAGCRLYLGGDSGLTHLAAAAGAPAVLALFGPTEPRIWAPPGRRVTVLQALQCASAPCATGREIPCPDVECLKSLTPAMVLAVASRLVAKG